MKPIIFLMLYAFLMIASCKSVNSSPVQVELSSDNEIDMLSATVDQIPFELKLRKTARDVDFQATDKIFSKIDDLNYEYIAIFSSGKHVESEIRFLQEKTAFKYERSDAVYKNLADAAIHLKGSDTCAFFLQGKYYSRIDGKSNRFDVVRATTSTTFERITFGKPNVIASSQTEKYYFHFGNVGLVRNISYSRKYWDEPLQSGLGDGFVVACITRKLEFTINDFLTTFGKHFEVVADD